MDSRLRVIVCLLGWSLGSGPGTVLADVPPVAAAPAAVAAAPAAAPPPATPPGRVYALGAPTWIYSEPRRSDRPIGSVRKGQSVALREAVPRPGPGCAGGFVAVAPFGHVCLDAGATLDGSSRRLSSLRALAPRPGPLPFRYALSNGAPMYHRLPTPAEWAREERFLGAPGSFGELSFGNRGHERLAEVAAIAAVDPVPPFLADGGSAANDRPRELLHKAIPLGSTVAYTATFAHGGRTWLMSADGTLVPADRVRPFRTSTFRGVELGAGVSLPLAWFRARPRPQYTRAEDGKFAATGASWPTRSHVGLHPGSVAVAGPDGRRYLPTEARRGQATLWADEADATVVEPRPRLPWGAPAGAKWIEISITRGTLVAYVGLTPVFATLVSPGAGGVPQRGRDPVRMSTTPLGVHRLTYKYRAQTMSPDEGEERTFWLAEVPHTQYFAAPFALHTAYWHESFGEPMSAGCVNLAPADGAWLFDWTEPRVPAEWEGAAPHPLTGAATVVAVYR